MTVFGNRSALGPPMGVKEAPVVGYWGYTSASGNVTVYDLDADGAMVTSYTKALSPSYSAFHGDFGWQPIIDDPSGLVAPGSVALSAWLSTTSAFVWVFDPIANLVYGREFSPGAGTKGRHVGGPFLSGSNLYAVVFYSDESTPSTVHLELWRWATDLTGETLLGSTTVSLSPSEAGGCTHHALTAEGRLQVDVVRLSDGQVLPVSVDVATGTWTSGAIRSRRYDLSDVADIDQNQLYPAAVAGAAGTPQHDSGGIVVRRWATVPDDVSSSYTYMGSNYSNSAHAWMNAAGDEALVTRSGDLYEVVPGTGARTLILSGLSGPVLIAPKE